MKPRHIGIFLLILWGTSQIYSQSISGQIVDAKTKEILPFVTVFISRTTKGTQADAKGHFSLKQLPVGYVKLVATMIGYKPFEKEFILKPDENISFKIELIEGGKELDEVKVVGKISKQWKRNYAQFLKIFLGKSKNVKKTKISNPYILSLINEKKFLKANADTPLKIRNEALGYNLDYSLSFFKADRENFQFGGNIFFQPIEPKNPSEQAGFEKNRIKAYKGSIRHFLISVAKGTSRKEGFLVYVDKDSSTQMIRNRIFSTNIPKYLTEVNPDTLVRFDTQLQRAILPKYRYEIHYLHNTDNATFYIDLSHEVSWIETKANNLSFSYQGVEEQPLKVVLMGSMGNRRVANFLPEDYQLPRTETDSLENLRTIPNYQTQEKIFVRTDRDAYFLNDTLWFKAYTLDATTHKPSLSQILHITLRNEKNAVFQYQFQINEGISQGFIALSDSLKGTYQLIAHTQLMRNFGEDIFFHRNIKILTKTSQNLVDSTKSDSILVQFFPEGGNLIEGINNHVGIRATYPDGSYAKISATLMDSLEAFSEEISEINGIGEFYCTPKKRQSLKLKLGNGKVFFMPPPLEKGYAMNLNPRRDDENIQLKIINNFIEAEIKPLRLIVHQRGQIILDTEILPKRQITSVLINKDDLPDEGILNILLLDALNHKMAERTFYNYSELDKIITVLKPQMKGIEAQIMDADSNAVDGSVLITVTDPRFISEEHKAENLRIYLMLNADLQDVLGQVEGILDTSKIAKRRLDLILLANKSRDYSRNTTHEFERESGITFQGNIKGYKNKKLDAKVLGYVSTRNNYLSFEAKPNLEGHFVSPPLVFEDTAKVMMKAWVEEDLNLNFELENPPPFVPHWVLLPELHFKTAFEMDTEIRAKINDYALSIPEKSTPNAEIPKKIDFRRNYSHANKIFKAEIDFDLKTSISTILTQKLPEFLVEKAFISLRDSLSEKMEQKKIRVFIDGLPGEWQNVSTISTLMIESIEVINDSLTLSSLGSGTEHGVINVLTKDGILLKDQNFKSFLKIGIASKREFVNNKSTHKETMYWRVKRMDKLSEKNDIKFLKTDKPIRITMEGISTTGIIVSENFELKREQK